MSLQCGTGPLTLQLSDSELRPISIEAVGSTTTPATPLVELLVLGEGRSNNQPRNLVRTQRGEALRYAGHETREPGITIVRQHSTDGLLTTETHITASEHAVTFHTVVANSGTRTAVIEAVTSAVLPVPFSMPETVLVSGIASWCTENRWRIESLEDAGLVDCATERMPVLGSASISRTSTSTWTTDGPLPVAALEDRSTGTGWAWQVAGGGAWRWELDSVTRQPGRFVLAASGATNQDHAWNAVLSPGESITTPQLTVTVSTDGWQGAIQRLTRERRRDAAVRTSTFGRTALIFNDYMNTIKADPTDEKLLPLIDAAAEVGAEVFCIDAGWYDDSGDWWPTVGEWLPSKTRFGALGLQGVLNHISDRGMVPGLWLEPESIGVRSPLRGQLPPSALIQREGIPVVEQGRHFLNLASPEARAHLDATFDRLIAMGVGFFKLDYNVAPGLGHEIDGKAAGAALQEHVNAYFEWFDALRDRHPSVLIENCSSGAMRQDWAQVSRFDLQSTSDQQDYLLYPPIAAGAPMMLLPEQCGNWAYSQPEMSDELIAFVNVTGLSGRPYLTGHLNRMSEAQRGLVREATDLWKQIRAHTTGSLPFWPAGLPRWSDDMLALGLACAGGESYLAVWNRAQEKNSLTVALDSPRPAGSIRQVYPSAMPGWGADLTADGAQAVIHAPAGPSARLFRIEPRPMM